MRGASFSAEVRDCRQRQVSQRRSDKSNLSMFLGRDREAKMSSRRSRRGQLSRQSSETADKDECRFLGRSAILHGIVSGGHASKETSV